MRTFIPSLAFFAYSFAGSACGTLTTYQSADPVAPGHWQGMAAAGAGIYIDRAQMSRTPALPIELGVRRGLADDLDVGLKLHTLGAEASVRLRVANGEWSWALLGAIGGMRTPANYTSIPPAWLGQLRLGAVATRHTSARFGWNVGPEVTGTLWIPAGGGSAGSMMVGVFGGFDWKLGERWHLIPELSLHRVLKGDFPVDQAAVLLGAAFARDW